MKKNRYILILSLFLSFITEGNPVISFFLEPMHNPEKLVDGLRSPDALATHRLYGILNHTPVAGIFATYAGYITTSDNNGEIVFPRKHQKAHVNIIITTEIIPVALFENTIAYWTLAPGVPAEMYSFEEKYNSSTKDYYWERKKVDLPTDNKIPLSAIVIIAKPHNIFIPSETSKTIQTANLTLPPIYVEKGINIVLNSTYILHIRHLFRAIESKKERKPLRIMTRIID